MCLGQFNIAAGPSNTNQNYFEKCFSCEYMTKCLDENGIIHEDLDVIKVGWRNLHHRVAGQTTFSGIVNLFLIYFF